MQKHKNKIKFTKMMAHPLISDFWGQFYWRQHYIILHALQKNIMDQDLEMFYMLSEIVRMRLKILDIYWFVQVLLQMLTISEYNLCE